MNSSEERGRNMGPASLVLGIVSIVFSIVPGFQWIGVITGLIGTVLGALGRKDPEKAGLATAGMVCSIIGLTLSVILYLACVACAKGLERELPGLFD